MWHGPDMLRWTCNKSRSASAGAVCMRYRCSAQHPLGHSQVDQPGACHDHIAREPSHFSRQHGDGQRQQHLRAGALAKSVGAHHPGTMRRDTRRRQMARSASASAHTIAVATASRAPYSRSPCNGAGMVYWSVIHSPDAAVNMAQPSTSQPRRRCRAGIIVRAAELN